MYFAFSIRSGCGAKYPTPVWLRINTSQAKITVTVFSRPTYKIQIQSGSGYSKEYLTPDPVGGSRSAVSSEISDLCEISDLLLFVNYFDF